MKTNVIDTNRPIFQPIKEAVKITGLSEYFLRQNLKAVNIPYIKCGKKILINMPRLEAELERLTDCSVAASKQ